MWGGKEREEDWNKIRKREENSFVEYEENCF